MKECYFYENAICTFLRVKCEIKERNFQTCSCFLNGERQRPEIDPDWVEFVNATNERYKDANTDV